MAAFNHQLSLEYGTARAADDDYPWASATGARTLAFTPKMGDPGTSTTTRYNEAMLQETVNAVQAARLNHVITFSQAMAYFRYIARKVDISTAEVMSLMKTKEELFGE
jgi:hypothetical protein